MPTTAPAASPPADAPATDADLALMAQSGITRIETFQYHVGGYRYSTLRDALAQAGRTSGAKDKSA